jgi:DNA-binding CsgD family transcriptional regulator
VETHRAHIFQKLRATSAGELVRIAAAAGLIRPAWD